MSDNLHKQSILLCVLCPAQKGATLVLKLVLSVVEVAHIRHERYYPTCRLIHWSLRHHNALHRQRFTVFFYFRKMVLTFVRLTQT